MTLQTIMTIIAMHWVADFVLQTDWQAKNKSKNNLALALHVVTYTFCLLWYAALIIPGVVGIIWVLANGAAHFGVDYVTSRINTYLWNKGRVHDFFVMVGFDQVIHYACLFGSLAFIGVV